MKLSKLVQLKHLLQTATDLRQPSEFFWEELASEPSFMSAGKIGTSVRLQRIIERAASHVLGGEQDAGMLMLLRIPRYSFWHGSCVFDGRISQVMYFDDIEQGLLTILEDPVTGMTRYVRISTLPVEGNGSAIPINPKDKPMA